VLTMAQNSATSLPFRRPLALPALKEVLHGKLGFGT
jgi:hypothetical protein